MPPIELPIEIVDAILDRIDPSDRNSFIKTSVLSSQWRTPSQIRLFTKINLNDARRFESLLGAIQNSTFLASVVSQVSIGVKPPLVWLLHSASANYAAAILDLLPNVISFRLEADEINPLRWVHVPFKLKNSIKNVLESEGLVELIVEWWEFEVPADELYTMLLGSSSTLKRLTLNMSLQPLLPPSVRIGEESPGSLIHLDLDYLNVDAGDFRSLYIGNTVDPLKRFIPPLHITSSNGLVFHTSADMTHNLRFEGWLERLKDIIGPHTKSLKIVGTDDDPPFDLTKFTRLEILTVVGKQLSPSARLATGTLKTLQEKEKLSLIQLVSSVRSTTHAETDFEDFLKGLSSRTFPVLANVNVFYSIEDLPMDIQEKLQTLSSSDRLRSEKFVSRLAFI